MGDVQVPDVAMLSVLASEGRALRGFSLIRNAQSFNAASHEPELFTSAGKQILLSPPKGLPLMNCNQSADYNTGCFSSEAEGNQLCKDVKNKGWSFACKLHANVWHAPISSGTTVGRSKRERRLSEDYLSRKASEAWVVQCAYIPMKCFQIPRTKMTLSEAALSKASDIRDRNDATRFLNTFGSHISERMFYLGGVFFKGVTVKSMGQTTLLNLLNEAERQWKGQAGANLLGVQLFEAEASGKGQKRAESSSNQESALKVEVSTQRVLTLGPPTAMEVEEFRRQLHDDHRSWAIIDSMLEVNDQREGVVGVWEILLDHAQSLDQDRPADAFNYKRAAKILCKCWMESMTPAGSLQDLSSFPGDLHSWLVQQSRQFLDCVSRDPAFVHRSRQHLLEDAPIPISQKSSLEELIKELKEFEDQRDIHEPASHAVRHYIKDSKATSEVPNATKFKSAVEIFQKYGFDGDGNLSSTLSGDVMKSMICDLEQIGIPPQQPETTPASPSAWIIPLTSSIFLSEPTSCTYKYRYVGDMLVDRDFYNDPCIQQYPIHADHVKYAAARRLIGCLRHHINPQMHPLQRASGEALGEASDEDVWDNTSDDEESNILGSSEAFTMAHQGDGHITPLELLVHIFEASDLPAQIAFCNVLLSQRAATLLLVPSNTLLASPPERTNESLQRSPFSNFIDALSFVNVSLEKERKVCIATDISLPRVVFLSNKEIHRSHAAIVASRTLSCEFVSQHSRGEMSALSQFPVIEVGVGFLNANEKGISQCVACLALLVTGPYTQLMDLITAVAHVVVLELEDEPSHPGFSITSDAKVLCWQETAATEGQDKKKKLIWGQETFLVRKIRRNLHSACSRPMQDSRQSLMSIFSSHITLIGRQLTSFHELQELVDQCDFMNVRDSLKLQSSFVKEASAYFERLQQKGHPGETQVRIKTCFKEQNIRRLGAKDVMSNQLMQLFHQLLDETEPAISRRVQLMWLEMTVAQKMHPILDKNSRRVKALFESSNRNPTNTQARKSYIKAKQELYVEKSLALHHLWREMCHIFEADPSNQRELAVKAAQHLLDGFPLEILDGDAGMFCELWVDTVLTELGMMTTSISGDGPARICVLSVIGLQSSGKSTILNRMFGASLQTSAGRCTRGVFIQLVPSERAEYDYVMLVDTEGIRSSEYFGLENSEVHDNRLATLGLLSGDASIFMVSNEDDSGLKEVLPMVLLAYKGSAMAESSGGAMKSKMVFVYRSVDTNDAKKLMGNKQKLRQHLKEAAGEVAEMESSCTSTEQDLAAGELIQTVFTEFRVEEDETMSDVKCMGNLKRGFMPPSDTPDWAYGEQVVALRDYIHKRVTDDTWEARSFKQWATQLKMVWDCICTANFELSFRNQVDFSSHQELRKKLQPLRNELLQKYVDVFESLEIKVRTMKDEESVIVLINELKVNVMDVESSKEKEVKGILGTKRWAKWRESAMQEWLHFCASTMETYKKRIVDLEGGVVRFEKIVAGYERQIKSTILKLFIETDPCQMEQNGEESRKQSFQMIFQKILKMAEESHPPMANEVPRKVRERYDQEGLTREFLHLLDTNPEKKVARSQSPAKKKPWYTNIYSVQSTQGDTDNVLVNLKTAIDQQLRDARQYSEVAVESIIKYTVNKLHEEKIHRKDKKEAIHKWVLETLTQQMQEIQRRWDQDHNVAEKLRKFEPRLWAFFEARAKGLQSAAFLIQELQHLFTQDHVLLEPYSCQMATKVAGWLGHAAWVVDWKVMRSYLDYHLLLLMETPENTDRLLEYTANGSAHFKRLTDVLFQHAFTDSFLKEEWDLMVTKVERCLMEQCTIARLCRDRSAADSFLHDLCFRLETNGDPKLATVVRNSINLEDYKANESELDADFFENKVPGLCYSIRTMSLDWGKAREELEKKVRERMENLHNENCRPRCGEACPRCGGMCHLPAGHSMQRKHECVHQPAGLYGIMQHKLANLLELTCLEQLDKKWEMMLDDGRRQVPMVEFEKEFPTWALPVRGEKSSLQVRECIFFNYQDALAKLYQKEYQTGKPCPPDRMPASYNHNPEHLRTTLRNNLRSGFQNDQEWADFEAMLRGA